MKNNPIYLENIVNIKNLIDDAKCYEVIRKLRWPKGKVRCPFCESTHVIRNGHDETEPERQKYNCKKRHRYFDDLTRTIFMGHHQPLRVWILCLYLMGLNQSNRQIAKELDLNEGDAQQMTGALRGDVTVKKPKAKLKREVEIDEVYIVAGHKGNPGAVKKKAEKEDVIV